MGRNNGSTGSSYPPAKTEGYVDVDRIETADNLVAIISQRKYDGAFTFGVSRTYVDHGTKKSTSFVPEFLIESYIQLLELVRKRIAELRLEMANKPAAKGA